MALPKSLTIPIRDAINEKSGVLTIPWLNFFNYLKEIIDPLGVEKTFSLLNNQAAPVKIQGLVFDKSTFKQAFIDYYIERVTATESLIESGTWLVTCKDQTTFSLEDAFPPLGDDSGTVFDIDANGNITYTAINKAAAQVKFKLCVRVRTLSTRNLVA